MLVLIVSKTLRPFVNILTPDDKYSLENREILKQPIQVQKYKELKISFLIFHFVSEVCI